MPAYASSPEEPEILVVAGVLRRDDRYFIARRDYKSSYPGCWEFPGGKVEFDEPLTDALVREWREEFDSVIKVGDRITEVCITDERGKHRIVVFEVFTDDAAFPCRIHAHVAYGYFVLNDATKAALQPYGFTPSFPHIVKALQESAKTPAILRGTTLLDPKPSTKINEGAPLVRHWDIQPSGCRDHHGDNVLDIKARRRDGLELKIAIDAVYGTPLWVLWDPTRTSVLKTYPAEPLIDIVHAIDRDYPPPSWVLA